jgi:O-antigen ligase
LLFGVFLSAVLVPLLPVLRIKGEQGLIGAGIIAAGLVQSAFAGEWKWTPLDAPMLAWCVVSVVAAFQARNPWLSIVPNQRRADGTATQLALAMTALGAARLTPDGRTWMLDAVIAVAVIIATISLAQVAAAKWALWVGMMPGMLWHTVGRGWGTMVNPVWLGGYMCLVLPVVLARALLAPSVWLVVATLLTAFGLMRSGTRGAWIPGLAAAMWVLAPWVSLPRVAIAGTGVVLGVIAMGPRFVLDRLVRIPKDTDGSWWGRTHVWKQTLFYSRFRPWFGWGWNTMAIVSPDKGGVYDTAHGDVFNVLFSTGYLGLAVYLVGWAVGIAYGISAAPILVVGALAYAVWVQTEWQHVGPANVFYAFLGMMVVR